MVKRTRYPKRRRCANDDASILDARVSKKDDVGALNLETEELSRMDRAEVKDQKFVVEASADRNLFKRIIWLQKCKGRLWNLDRLPTHAREQVDLLSSLSCWLDRSCNPDSLTPGVAHN